MKNGIRPQRMRTSSRAPVSLSFRMTGWKVVGAMLCLGDERLDGSSAI